VVRAKSAAAAAAAIMKRRRIPGEYNVKANKTGVFSESFDKLAKAPLQPWLQPQLIQKKIVWGDRFDNFCQYIIHTNDASASFS
jgi:hypothetical protein